MTIASAQDGTSRLAEAYREFDRNLRTRQSIVGCALALAMMPAGFTLDYFVYPHLTWKIFQVRLFCDVLLLPCLALLLTPLGKRRIGITGTWWLAMPALSICWMIYASEGAVSPYYAGLNLVLLASSLLMPYTMREAAAFCVFVLASYSAACLLHVVHPPATAIHNGSGSSVGILFNNLYFLALNSVVCVTACHYSSRRRYEDFRLRHELDGRNHELDESYQRLSQLDRLKSAFFANISHELRTPLTLIISPIEDLLRSAAALPGHARDCLEIARQNALRLLKLISDLLDIVRLEEGRAQLHKELMDLAVFVPAMADSVKHLATVKGLTLKTDFPTVPLVVSADPAGLEKIVLNILTNAIKFTPQGGCISVRCQKQENLAVVEIEDTGIGIPEQSLPHIFDRFHQVDGSSTRKYQGVGIGLALARDLAQQHGGRLSAKSQVGRGTTFRIELPAEDAAVATVKPGEPAAADPIAKIYKAANRAVTLSTDQVVAADETGAGEHLVLVVDDEPDMRRFLVGAVAKDHRAIQAGDGPSGLELARQKRPDLVLLDLMLPGMDGLDVCGAIKGNPATKSTKVVLLTARTDEQSKITALERGADDFMTKPFSTTELQTRLRNLIRAAELEEQLRAHNEKLQATLKKLQETEVQLVQSEKMNALGKLSAGLLHEINNPLNFTFMALQVAEQEAGENESLKETLKDIDQGMNRIRGVISDLRAFAHPSELAHKAPFDLNDALTSALQLTAHELGQFPVERQGMEQVKALGMKTQVVHVFMNLLMNSADALKAKAAAKSPESTADGPPRIVVSCAPRGDRLAVSVRDNGVGVRKEDLPRLLEPFFTTKQVGQGMGLGLSICHTIVKNHGGEITISSEQGKWTEVSFDLPVEAPAPVASIAPSAELVGSRAA